MGGQRRTQLEQMLSYVKETLRINSPYCAELRQLPRTATLLAHHTAVSLASKPRLAAYLSCEEPASSGLAKSPGHRTMQLPFPKQLLAGS